MWIGILQSLFATFAPLLEKWLGDWLKARLTEHAYAIQTDQSAHDRAAVASTIDPKAAQLVLLHRVRDELWRWQFAKRAAVDAAIEAVK